MEILLTKAALESSFRTKLYTSFTSYIFCMAMFAVVVNRLLKRNTVQCCPYVEKLVFVHEGNIYSLSKIKMLIWG